MDNSSVIRRMQARGGQIGALGDYVSSLPNRILTTGPGTPLGPISSPTVLPPQASNDPTATLAEIRDLLRNMPFALSTEFRTRFILHPRESMSFIVPGEVNPLPAGPGAAVAVAQFQMNEQFTGFLEYVGVNVIPAGAFTNVTWQIRINGNIHPNFNNRVFNASTISTPLAFPLELVQSRTVQLVAVNNGGVPLDVQGVLVGFTEILTDAKRYGSTPAAGVA